MKLMNKSSAETRNAVKVPRFPVISLRATADQVIVEAPGVYEEFARDENQSLFEVAEPAALKASQTLGLRVCKVVATDAADDDATFELVADVDLGELQELSSYNGEPGQYEVVAHPEPENQPWYARLGGGRDRDRYGARGRGPLNRRTAAYVATAGLLAVAVAVPVSGVFRDEPEAQPEPYHAAPAQLPVQAPPGWGTYAGWHQSINQRAQPVIFDDVLLAPAGRKISALDPNTGEPKWSTDAGMEVSEFAPMTDTLIAVTDGKAVSLLDTSSRQVTATSMPKDGQIEFGYGDPVKMTPSSPVVHVLTDSGEWMKRTMPAGSEIAGAANGAVTAASTDGPSARVWSLTEDSAKLPKPATIAGVAGKGGKTSPVESCTGSFDTVLCQAKKGTATEWSSSKVGRKDNATSISRIHTAAFKGSSAAAATAPEVDRSTGSFLARGIWVTNEALVQVGSEAHIGGGRAVRSSQKESELLDPKGKTVATGTKTKAYPAAVSKQNTAIVVAADPSDPAATSVYGLPTNPKEGE